MKRLGAKTLAVVAALGGWTAATMDTPLAPVPAAQAEALPSVWVNKVNKIAANIAKSRQALASDAAAIVGDDFKAKQFAKRIENYRSTLAKVPDSDDAVLTDARAMLAALDQEFASAKGGATTSAAPDPAPTPQPETATAAPAPAPASAPSADVRPLVSGERVRVKKLTRDMTNVLGSITTDGPSLYQDPAEYNAAVDRFNQFTAAIDKYPQADDPDVKAARETYLKLRAAMTSELARGKQQYEILGDVAANLRALQNRDNEVPIPAALTPPFGPPQVEEWLAASRTARDAAKKDFQYIQDIMPIVYLPEFTKSGRKAEFGAKDLPRLAQMAKSRYDRANNGLSVTKQKIKSALRDLDQQVEAPTARTDTAALARHRKALDAMIPVAESAIHLEAVLGRPTEEAEAAVAALLERRKDYEATREAAIDAVRMPEPASTDAERLAIAAEIVARPQYEFGEHGPIILNTAEILEKERQQSEIDIDDVDVFGGEIRMSGTKETTVWKWREFQFATALKEEDSDLWRIYYIKPKYFTSGASTTPLNRWISGGVVEGELIRAEHVGK